MRLLITTQAVDKNDPNLGFFHRWLEEFATRCEHVTVVCLRAGDYSLPGNVTVLPLGVPGRGLFPRIKKSLRFLSIIREKRNEYDAVFVHMNHEYVILAGALWKWWKKPVILWYTHKKVSLTLRVAVSLLHQVATASADSFRVRSRKVVVVGHGIDTTFFVPDRTLREAKRRLAHPAVLAAGRISPVKRHELVLSALSLMPQTQLWIAGDPITNVDEAYTKTLRGQCKALGISKRVSFLGPLTQDEMREAYRSAQALVHTSMTGSIDKVVLEALACGIPVVTTSIVFRKIGAPVIEVVPQPEEVAAGIERAFADKMTPAERHAYVEKRHGLPTCIARILSLYPNQPAVPDEKEPRVAVQ